MVKLPAQLGTRLSLRPGMQPPVSQSAPQVTGTATSGQTLTTTNGSWNNQPSSFSYQWLRNGTAISGATAKTYTLTSADVNASISCRVRATNKAGSAQATSNTRGPVAAMAPRPRNAPATASAARVGDTMTTSTGDWDGDPDMAYTYQWASSTDGQAWTPIAGATNASYTVANEMYGKLMRAIVTATNAGGSDSMPSNMTTPVAGLPPQNTSAPTVSGGLLVGNVLTANVGAWSGYPPPTTTIQWLADGAPISGANALTLTLGLVLLGKSLSVRVTATNAEGSTTVTSAATGLIKNLL